jgi:hypothetical protein
MTTMRVLERFATRKEIFRVDEKCSYWISPTFDVSSLSKQAVAICVIVVIGIVVAVSFLHISCVWLII